MSTFLILLITHIILKLGRRAGISCKGWSHKSKSRWLVSFCLLKHLVLFSVWQARGRKHVRALSPDIFSFCNCIMKFNCLLKRNNVNSTTMTLTKAHFCVCGPASSVASFPGFILGTLPGAGKAGAQVTGICGEMIQLKRCHVKCHDVHKGDVTLPPPKFARHKAVLFPAGIL